MSARARRPAAKAASAAPRDRSAEFEKAIARKPRYVLRLYIAGSTPRSARALRNLKKLCHEYLGDQYDLEVVDVYQQKTDLEKDQILAVPVLVKKLPQPVRKFIGDLSDTEKILVGLDVVRKRKEGESS